MRIRVEAWDPHIPHDHLSKMTLTEGNNCRRTFFCGKICVFSCAESYLRGRNTTSPNHIIIAATIVNNEVWPWNAVTIAISAGFNFSTCSCYFSLLFFLIRQLHSLCVMKYSNPINVSKAEWNMQLVKSDM